MHYPDYPRGFSPQARNRVEKAELEASMELEQGQARDPPAGFTKHQHDLCEFFLYILCVVEAFAREALELGKQGIWTIGDI